MRAVRSAIWRSIASCATQGLASASETIERRVPVVAGVGGDGDSSESLLLAGLRSALCAPIVSDGDVVACLYVTHRQVGDLFGDLEIQLAEFIATLAGAALEHVAGSEDCIIPPT